MRNLKTIALLAVVALSANAFAEVWNFVPFDSIVEGAFTYNADGSNVVVDGTAFRDTMGSTLSVQKIAGDGINNPVSGNFGFYAAFNYTDTDNVFAWANSIPNTSLGIEICAHTIDFASIPDDYFAFDARDMAGVDYLQATFNELAADGCTEIAPGVWMDIAVDSTNSRVAISVVTNIDFGSNDIDTSINAGSLDGEIAGQWRASGIYLAAVPEPATLALLGLGGLVLRRKRK